jgi:cysteinyl-tRNA synthetase
VAPGAKFESFLHLDQVLGLDLATEIGRPRGPGSLPSGAAELLAERERARADGDWTESDRLRGSLAELGVQVRDTPGGQAW